MPLSKQSNCELDVINEYRLLGYLNKHSNHSASKSYGLISKKRWFVYSESTCKLYFYKSDKDPDPLGDIDIAFSSLFYDENCSSNIFIISCGEKEFILEAESPQKRMYWLQNLQNERRKFTEQITSTLKTSRNSVGRPASGLVREYSVPLLDQDHSDPNFEIVGMINKSLDSALPRQEDSHIKRSELGLSFNNLWSAIVPKSNGPKLVVNTKNSPPKSSSVSEPISPSFDFGQKFRSSFRRLRPRSNYRNSTENNEEICKKCVQLQEDYNNMVEENSHLKDRCDACKEAVNLLHKELELHKMEKSTWEELIEKLDIDQHIIEILRGKDNKILELEHSQHQLRNLLASLSTNIRDEKQLGKHLQEKVAILTTALEAKDNTVMDLSLKFDTLNRSYPRPIIKNNSTSNFYSSATLEAYPRPGTISTGTQTIDLDYEMLKDKLEGYKCQNSFLNKEILELNLILKRRKEREQKLISESSNWEAKFYQIQSKYLLLLNDLHSPQSSHDSAVLSQLLEDVVHGQGPADLRVVECKGKEYNEFGFCVTAPNGCDLYSKAAFIQKMSKARAAMAEQKNLSNSSGDFENHWESFLAGTNARELPNHSEMKYLIREGIPYQYKGKVWKLLIESRLGNFKKSLSANYYQSLLSKKSSMSTLDPAAKQIELDLLRTLPNNRHYESPYADGIPKLRRVLLAYSRHNLAVGYCQGLNRLCAIALLFLEEEDAFWCLVYIIEFLMPKDYYTRYLVGSQVDQHVLKDLIKEKLPKLHDCFDDHQIDVSLFTFNWFLCIYVDAISPDVYLYVWDSFLFEGSKVLFRFALAILKLCEDEIISKPDYMSIFAYLRSVQDQITDLVKLKQLAFEWTNPLSKKFIRNRMEYFTAVVKKELDVVEADRKLFYSKVDDSCNHFEADEVYDSTSGYTSMSGSICVNGSTGANNESTCFENGSTSTINGTTTSTINGTVFIKDESPNVAALACMNNGSLRVSDGSTVMNNGLTCMSNGSTCVSNESTCMSNGSTYMSNDTTCMSNGLTVTYMNGESFNTISRSSCTTDNESTSMNNGISCVLTNDSIIANEEAYHDSNSTELHTTTAVTQENSVSVSISENCGNETEFPKPPPRNKNCKLEKIQSSSEPDD